MIKRLIYTALMLIVITGCAKMDNYLRPEANRKPNEVEKFYSQGKEAEKAQQWKQAFKYYERAYELAKETQGIIYFEKPMNNNYFTTFKVLYKAMNSVSENFDAPGNWQSNVNQTSLD